MLTPTNLRPQQEHSQQDDAEEEEENKEEYRGERERVSL
jgi:hypothetical protein